MSKEKCERTIIINGKVETTKGNHSFSWSGEIPCTGIYRYVYCGEDYKDCKNKEV